MFGPASLGLMMRGQQQPEQAGGGLRQPGFFENMTPNRPQGMPPMPFRPPGQEGPGGSANYDQAIQRQMGMGGAGGGMGGGMQPQQPGGLRGAIQGFAQGGFGVQPRPQPGAQQPGGGQAGILAQIAQMRQMQQQRQQLSQQYAAQPIQWGQSPPQGQPPMGPPQGGQVR